MSQTVKRALSVVDYLAGAPRTLTEVTEFLELHKSTALRVLQTLEESGFARKQADGRYVVGFTLIAIAQTALEKMDLHDVARPHLSRLSERYGHTVHLAQLIGSQIIYVDKIDGEGSVRMHSRVGRPAGLHTAAVAKVILAFQDEEVQRQLAQQATFQRYTPTTITSPGQLSHELELIHARGWAEDNGEYEDFLGCIAAPIRDARGAVVAGISLTALRSLVDRERLATYVPNLIATADGISRDLGWAAQR